MSESDKQLERSAMVSALTSQWRGERNDGVQMDSEMVESVENAVMSKSSQIEGIAAENLKLCIAFRQGGDLSSWENYLRALPAQLTAGDCKKPLTYTLFNYLDINTGWQQPVSVCKGNKVHIFATTADKYRISNDGPWITAEGDPAIHATDPKYPCHDNENCMAGQLIGKFETDKGVVLIFPIGADTTFLAPENGTLSISINDDTWGDNRYFKSATIEDRTAVTIEPAP